MRLAIAIFGLVTSLSAQVVCQAVDSNARVDIASLDSAMIFKIDNSWHVGVNKYLVTDYQTRPVRCYEHLVGTIALNNGEVVHSAWIESPPSERWMSDSSSCSVSRSKEPLYRFMIGIREEQQRETEGKGVTVPPEFCRELIGKL